MLVEVPLGEFVRIDKLGDQEVERDRGEIEADVWDERELLIHLPLRNAGSGVALLGTPQLEIDAGPLAWTAVARHTAVPAGELTRIDFTGTWPDHETTLAGRTQLDQPDAAFSVSIPYTDVEGRQAATTRVYVKHRVLEEDDVWVVDYIELLREGEHEPFAVLSGRNEGDARG